jgi:hypothetical protein
MSPRLDISVCHHGVLLLRRALELGTASEKTTYYMDDITITATRHGQPAVQQQQPAQQQLPTQQQRPLPTGAMFIESFEPGQWTSGATYGNFKTSCTPSKSKRKPTDCPAAAVRPGITLLMSGSAAVVGVVLAGAPLLPR